MKHAILSLACLFCLVFGSAAQPSKEGPPAGTMKSFYGEFGGSGLVFSANYDARFKGSNGLGYRLGVGGAGGTGGFIATFPIGLNYLGGKGPHYVELGASATLITSDFSIDDNTASAWFFMPSVGYRYSKPTKSFNGRIYVGPFIANGFMFFPFGGLSVGFTL